MAESERLRRADAQYPDDQPLVSIAVATYNGARYLAEQLDSLLAQTYPNVEILIADDRSTDETLQIIQTYAATVPAIRYRVNAQNLGYIRNFEGLIRECRGRIVFLCDQDDRWEPTKVARHLEAYADTSIQWVCNRVYLIDGDGSPSGQLEDLAADYYDEKPLAQVAWGRCVIGCATSFRAEPLMRAIPIAKHARAHDSWIQLMFHGKRRALIEDRLQAYRIHASNTAGLKSADTPEAQRRSMQQHRAFLKELVGDTRIGLASRAYFMVLSMRRAAGAMVQGFRSH